MSIKAYTRTLRNTEEPRDIERRLLARATAGLHPHQEAFDAAGRVERAALLTEELRAALWENQRVWMALRTDLALPANGLAPDLRAGLLSLSIWVSNHTQSVLGGRGTLAPLVEVNRNIIAGLSAAPEARSPAAAAV